MTLVPMVHACACSHRLPPCNHEKCCAGRRIDGDTLLMRDMYPVTILVGYQFAMRWMNAHVFYLKRASPLAARLLRQTMALRLDHPRFREDVIDKVLGL